MTNVTRIGHRGRGGKGDRIDAEREGWLARQAANVVAQLPENDEEAIAVLQYAAELVEYLRSASKRD